MGCKLVGGNAVAADYDICMSAPRENGVSVPAGVRAGQDEAAAQRVAAFRETNCLVESAPSMPWEDDSRDAVRDILKSRYM